MFHRLQIFSAFIIDLYKASAICFRHIAHNVFRTSDVIVFSVTLVFSNVALYKCTNTLLLGRITIPVTHHAYWNFNLLIVWGGADKSLARPGRKQATATKLGIYSTYSPRSPIHFLARFSNVCKPLKKIQKVVRPTSPPWQQWLRVGRKIATFQLFFQSREQVVVRRGQIWRTGWWSRHCKPR